MKVDVLTRSGQPAGRQIELPDEIFAIAPNEHVLYLAVKQERAAERSGTHKAKERGEIAGSTRKIKRQKGTGTARAGSIKNPLFRGGGRVFGPRPRKYDIKLNRKVQELARKSALSGKLAAGALKVVEDFDLETPKTKDYAAILEGFGLTGKKSLLVVPELKGNLVLSSRNIQRAKVEQSACLSVYDIMNANTVLLSEKAVEALSQQLTKN